MRALGVGLIVGLVTLAGPVCVALGQGVTFSLDAEGVGSNVPLNPWAVYWSSPVPAVAGVHVGVTPPGSVYAAPDDNLDALYSGSSLIAPIQVVLFSLDETAPNTELYRTILPGVSGPTGVSEFTLGLNPNSNLDAFDHWPAAQPAVPFTPGDWSVDDPDPLLGGVPPPGESEDIYFPPTPVPYTTSVSGTAIIGLLPTDNIDAWRWVPGSDHLFGKICPVTGTVSWPTGALFSVEPGNAALDPGDVYWSDLSGVNPAFVYLDDVNDLGLADTVDIDALDALGAGERPEWLVPEPTSLALLALGGIGGLTRILYRRRRRR